MRAKKQGRNGEAAPASPAPRRGALGRAEARLRWAEGGLAPPLSRPRLLGETIEMLGAPGAPICA